MNFKPEAEYLEEIAALKRELSDPKNRETIKMSEISKMHLTKSDDPPSPAFLEWSFKAGYGTVTSDIQLALWDAWQAGQADAAANHEYAGELKAARAAILDARQLLADICNHEANPEDEAEKWLRAYGWPNAEVRHPAEPG